MPSGTGFLRWDSKGVRMATMTARMRTASSSFSLSAFEHRLLYVADLNDSLGARRVLPSRLLHVQCLLRTRDLSQQAADQQPGVVLIAPQMYPQRRAAFEPELSFATRSLPRRLYRCRLCFLRGTRSWNLLSCRPRSLRLESPRR